MSALEFLEPVFKVIPEVKSPVHREDFNEKLKWTALVLVLYFILTQIPLYGLAPGAIDSFAQLRAVMAGSFGSILTLGIGPIVTASIVLQLLVGSNLLDLDLSSHKDKSHFQATQKILSIVFTVFEASVLVLTGNLVPMDGSYTLILIAQLVVGALVIIYLDEVVSKWGFGSGIGLFIAAGVCQAIIVGTFSILNGSDGLLAGIIPKFIQLASAGTFDFSILIPLIATIIVFLVVLYGESMKVEIPISHGQVKGHGRIRGSVGKYPLKFVYSSNMPVILTSALLVNVTLFANVFQKIGVPILGHLQNGKAVDGIAWLLSTPNLTMFITEPIHVLVYAVFFIACCMLFSYLWVEISGLNAKKISEQLHKSGIQIPGFRSSKRQLYKILKKYIPALTIISGIYVGLIAFLADLTGALGGGTGVLLTVGILHKLYEEMAQEQLMSANPVLRKVLGGD
ncbi:preprotein translocase subunit SecY [uncultured Methanobrevibacter sp.]|uniref:preprotein translocase subunit SecY n=1 Tax=uncultured Methanobrevibacter sp. TaxID=253161 RepID=UPI0025F3E3A1|nr:preprotein translocase subunit SecY [uncultured Methanobrevibacter sp.]MCI6994634.1 preprotein translocase subunit SecY [Methanobrevibacter sp.]